MTDDTIRWLADKGFAKADDGYERAENLTDALRVVTRFRLARPDDAVVQRADKPYVIEMSCADGGETNAHIYRIAICDGKVFALANALKLCEDCFWRDAALFGRLLLVAGALHGKAEWIDGRK